MKEKYWIALIKANNDYYVAAGKDGSVSVEMTEEKMINSFTSKYTANHVRGHEASMSAVINNVQIEPSVVNMSVYEMGSKLFDLEKGVKVSRINTVSGGIHAIKCNKERKTIEKIFDSGSKPDLIGRNFTY